MEQSAEVRFERSRLVPSSDEISPARGYCSARQSITAVANDLETGGSAQMHN
jgi:hypothetical protein